MHCSTSGCHVLDMVIHGTYRLVVDIFEVEEMTNLCMFASGCKPYVSYIWSWQQITTTIC